MSPIIILHRERKGFTLVELLVVIGVIAVLISVLLPALQAARRQADRVKCLSSLKEIGNAFQMYSNDAKGWFPMAQIQYPPNGTPDWPVSNRIREKRWYDLISRYCSKDRIELNPNGNTSSDIFTIRNTNNVLWGCPAWNRAATNTSLGQTPTSISYDLSTGGCGYAMNIYVEAPATITNTMGNGVPGNRTNWTNRTNGAANADGWFYKQTKWTKPTERCLIYDSIHRNTSVTANWPWWANPTTTQMPKYPDGISYTVDFNRHGVWGRIKEGTKSLNMLFADCHAEAVSSREASHAIRFN